MMALRCQIKREEHIMVVLAPRATDGWLNEVPVGILSLALDLAAARLFNVVLLFNAFLLLH